MPGTGIRRPSGLPKYPFTLPCRVPHQADHLMRLAFPSPRVDDGRERDFGFSTPRIIPPRTYLRERKTAPARTHPDRPVFNLSS
jgi:hypothetical protein